MNNRDIGLLETDDQQPKGSYFDSVLKFGIKGQKALTVSQCFTIEKLFKNWSDWRVKVAVWLISKTEL